MHPQVEYLLTLPNYPQRSPEWFAQRKDKLTSSDVDTVLGLNKYQTYLDVLFKKCGIAPEFTGNVATKHGQKFETEAIALYCHFHKVKNYSFGLIPHPTVDFLAGSPDDITDTGIVIEVKCPLYRKIIHGEIPTHYQSQVKMNMEICGLDKAVFIEYKPSERALKDPNFRDVDEPNSGKYELNVVHIDKDPDWLGSVFPILDAFWKEVIHYRVNGIDKHPSHSVMVIKSAPPKIKVGLDIRDIKIVDEDFAEVFVSCLIVEDDTEEGVCNIVEEN